MAQVQLDTAIAAAAGLLSAAETTITRSGALGQSTRSVIAPAPPPLMDTDVAVFGQRQPSVAVPTNSAALPAIGEEPAFASAEAEALVQTTAASTGARPSSIRALMKEIAALGHIFNLFSNSYRDLYIGSLKQYGQLTQNQVSGMNAMAIVTIVSSVVGGAAGMVAPIAPGLIPAGGIAGMPFLTADFVKAVLENTGKLFPSVGESIKTVVQGPVVEAESKRAMVDRAEISVEQQMMDQLTATLREVRQIVEAIMNAKSRQEG